MWRQLSQIPTDVLRTTDRLVGRAATWAVRVEAGSAIVAEAVGGGCAVGTETGSGDEQAMRPGGSDTIGL